MVAIWCNGPLLLGWQLCSVIKLPGTEGSFWSSWFLYSDEEESASVSACVDDYFMGYSCVEEICQHLGSVNQKFGFYSLQPGKMRNLGSLLLPGDTRLYSFLGGWGTRELHHLSHLRLEKGEHFVVWKPKEERHWLRFRRVASVNILVFSYLTWHVCNVICRKCQPENESHLNFQGCPRNLLGFHYVGMIDWISLAVKFILP